MNYLDVMPQIQGNKILVTGPQRSGTTICAKILAHDLGFNFYPEERINISSFGTARKMTESQSGFVLQCPAICHVIHELDATIIMVARPVNEIISSEIRVGWQGERKNELKKYNRSDGIISLVKYQAWYTWQKELCKEAYEIDYHSLDFHPLWIPIEKRHGFNARQTE